MNDLPEAFNELGVKLGLLVTGWLTVALVVIAIAALAAVIVFGLDELGFAMAVAFLSGIFAVIVAVVWGIMMIPFDGKYQHYYEVSGHVDKVSNVLSDADGELTRQPVVTLDSIERPLVIDDPRAANLQGRDVVLRCTVEWNYQAADSYSCRIVDFGAQS